MKNICLLSVAFFFCLFLKAQPATENKQVEWINNNCIPINYVTAGNGFDDLKSLKILIGDARIVALGECTHGSSEIFSMKHRLLELLVKEKGFTIFSIEANMPEAYALNDYIIDGKGDPKKLLAGMYFWTWNTQEVLDMIEWMKKYNETAKDKIQFTGFDMQFWKVSSKIVRDFCLQNSITVIDKLNDYDSIAATNSYNLKNNNKTTSPKLMGLATQIINGISATTNIKVNSSFAWCKQNAVILWQYAASNSKYQFRDESMALNIKWIAEQNPGSKLVIWAHNGHVNNKRFWMGKYLNNYFGSAYFTIGFSTEAGTYTAYNRTSNLNIVDTTNILAESTKKDYEFYFKNADAENFILLLRGLIENKENKLLFQNKNLRHIGARTMEGKFQFRPTELIKEFDALIFLKHTTASKCFSAGTK